MNQILEAMIGYDNLKEQPGFLNKLLDFQRKQV